ncbi:MAG: single-stranded-DNA-specific exonuclease RecJ [Spirochaetota bacterium]|nr:MAG: single-stranded-DNA-specific exonuclease RecJ [Spirochaetota bacterium]
MKHQDLNGFDNSPEWIFQEIEKTRVEKFSELTGLSRVVSKILLLRGIETEEALSYYLDGDIYKLHNPFLFNHMVKTVLRVKKAVNTKEKIFIFGDRDVDGVLSTAMLYNMLKRFDAEVFYKVPEGEYGYGIENRDIDFASDKGASLLIAVDTGTSSISEIEYASRKGIETVIIDHHVQTGPLPEAFSILNPKTEDEGYTFKDLSAGGVVLKFIHAFILSYTKNFNRVFIPAFPNGERVNCLKVRNGLVEESLEIKESIHYPVDPDCTIVIDTEKQLPDYFSSWLSDKKVKQIRLTCSQSYNSVEEFADIFINLFTSKQKKSVSFVKSFIDLGAISTISDIMPLFGENRIIVREGLKQITTTENLGLKVLLSYCDLPEGRLNAKAIAWNVAPVINSAGRMGDAHLAVKLFTTDDPHEANELSRILIDLNEKRKDKGRKNLDIIRPLISEKHKTEPVIVLSTDTAEHGVTGIIANRISRELCKPAIIIVNDGSIGVGSGRGGNNFDLMELVISCSDLLVKYGGHRSAIGFTIDTDNIEQFIHKVHSTVSKDIDRFQYRNILEIDENLLPEDLTFELLDELEIFEPSGVGNELPKFSLLGTTAINPTQIGKEKDHIRFFIPTKNATIPVLGWGLAGKGMDILDKNSEVDIVFSVEENNFRGERLLQLNLHDIRPSTSTV